MALLEEQQDGHARGPPTEGAAIARVMHRMLVQARAPPTRTHLNTPACDPCTPCILLFVGPCHGLHASLRILVAFVPS